MLTKLTWPSLAESLYNFCSTLVAFRSFILCSLDGYNKALCNDDLYLVKGGPASGSIILYYTLFYVLLWGSNYAGLLHSEWEKILYILEIRNKHI